MRGQVREIHMQTVGTHLRRKKFAVLWGQVREIHIDIVGTCIKKKHECVV